MNIISSITALADKKITAKAVSMRGESPSHIQISVDGTIALDWVEKTWIEMDEWNTINVDGKRYDVNIDEDEFGDLFIVIYGLYADHDGTEWTYTDDFIKVALQID
jgi:hypothetical protein